MLRYLLTLLFIALGLLVTRDAGATGYVVEFCVVYGTEFIDAGAGDYWQNEEADRPARGIYLAIEKFDANSGGTSQGFLWADYVDDSDGCFSSTFYDTLWYDITALSQAEVNGVTIAVWDDESSPAHLQYQFYESGSRFHPSAATAIDLPIPADTDSAMAAVGAWVMWRNNAGLGGSSLWYNNNACCNGGYQRHIRAATMSRSIIGHETGHGVYRRRDNDQTPNENQGSATDDCDGEDEDGTLGDSAKHSTTEKEWQSTAIKEGTADVYSTWAWNDITESDCVYDRQHRSDFNLSGDFETPDGIYNCEGEQVAGLGARDWLEERIAASDTLGCDGTSDHRSTQYDAQRYGWDMLTDEGVPFGDWIDIIDGMNMYDWAATHDLLAPSNNPIHRLEASADAVGWGTAHDNQKDNGQDP